MSRKYTILSYVEKDVAFGRFDTNRGAIKYIVLHTTVGKAQTVIDLFAAKPAPGKETSAHYMVKLDGGLIAFLEEYNTAYHCGNYAFNQQSIGIEHEDGGDYNGVRPDTLYNTSAKLVADICKFYSIPCDAQHIYRHKEVPGSSTACPDALDTNKIIAMAQKILNPPPLTSDQKLQKIKDISYSTLSSDEKIKQIKVNL